MYTVRLMHIPENGVLQREDLHLGPADLGLGPAFDPAGLTTSWELTRMMGKVYGKVHVESAVRLNCGRCLRDFSAPIRADFGVLFEPRPRNVRGAESKGVVDVEEDAGPSTVYFDGEELPLGEEIRQELELALPYSAQCGPACRGLCPGCGANLNDGPCACAQGKNSPAPESLA